MLCCAMGCAFGLLAYLLVCFILLAPSGGSWWKGVNKLAAFALGGGRGGGYSAVILCCVMLSHGLCSAGWLAG